MSRRPVRFAPPRNPDGEPRVVLPLGGAEHYLTVKEAVDIYSGLGEAIVAARQFTDVSSPLPEQDLSSLEDHAASSGTDTPPIVRNAILRACSEIRRWRKLSLSRLEKP